MATGTNPQEGTEHMEHGEGPGLAGCHYHSSGLESSWHAKRDGHAAVGRTDGAG